MLYLVFETLTTKLLVFKNFSILLMKLTLVKLVEWNAIIPFCIIFGFLVVV